MPDSVDGKCRFYLWSTGWGLRKICAAGNVGCPKPGTTTSFKSKFKSKFEFKLNQFSLKKLRGEAEWSSHFIDIVGLNWWNIHDGWCSIHDDPCEASAIHQNPQDHLCVKTGERTSVAKGFKHPLCLSSLQWAPKWWNLWSTRSEQLPCFYIVN